jgi:hypothetical protein
MARAQDPLIITGDRKVRLIMGDWGCGKGETRVGVVKGVEANGEKLLGKVGSCLMVDKNLFETQFSHLYNGHDQRTTELDTSLFPNPSSLVGTHRERQGAHSHDACHEGQ